jgi:NADH-quinone oxidoreductase subunit N
MVEVKLPSIEELTLVGPELALIVAMCAVVMVPFVQRRSVALPVVTAFIGLFVALFAALQIGHIPGGGVYVFAGSLAIDPFSQFFKMLLIVFALFILLQWLITSRSQTSVFDVPDYLCLLLGAVLGMALMVSATNLVMIVVAMETASLPSFALAGFRKRHRVATEGSLKYVLFGAASSAIGIYGMSLIYASTGEIGLAEIGAHAAREGISPLMGVGLMAMLAGIAFKLSAAPMHFWCPDVFEGAPIEITTFLSVASKGAAVCLLMRVLLSFGAAGAGFTEATQLSFVGLATGVAIVGGITATWGNLVAMHQSNIKRLLAYSSIAHAGYMIMAVSLVAAVNSTIAQDVAGAILFYLFIYMFMNLGAFTAVAMIAQHTGSEDIRDYVGLRQRSPAMAWALTLFLLSLFGMPGLGGFMGKIYLSFAMIDVVGAPAFVLIIVLFINTVISLYYYMRPVYYMMFKADEKSRPCFVPRPAGLALTLICAVMLLWTGILPSAASELAKEYATVYVKAPSDSAVVGAPSTDPVAVAPPQAIRLTEPD